MKEKIKEFLLDHLSFLPPEWVVIIISAMPILELRGGIPVAYLYNFSYIEAMLFSVIGNILPIFPLLLLFQPLSSWLRKYRWYERFYQWMFLRTMHRRKNVEKFGALGLILFTAIPIPTTGAYTACVAAAIFAIRLRYAASAIIAGVLISAIFVGSIIYSVF